jgi:CheY-like chemotaxis protein
VELRRAPVDLGTVIGAAIDVARPLVEARGHRLALDLPDEALRLHADAVRLAQILSNLLTNAAKYSGRGGDISLRVRREGDWISMAVRDKGIGIAPEMMPRLFTLFSQGQPAREHAEGGLGIGLALVRAFVSLHGGTVTAHSEGPGKGSEFVVRLPMGGAGQATRPEEARPDEATAPAPLRVLVADDNVDSAETSAMLLRLWGHEVCVASDGREAMVAAESFRPQVAILDIGMPNLSGYEVAEALRATDWGRAIRLVAVTGWGQDEDRERAARAGFDRHLPKPVDPALLRPLLE